MLSSMTLGLIENYQSWTKFSNLLLEGTNKPTSNKDKVNEADQEQ